MIPPYNPDIFQRIYNDVLEIKEDLEKSDNEENLHEWIDFEDHVYRPCILQGREWVLIGEQNGIGPVPIPASHLHLNQK